MVCLLDILEVEDNKIIIFVLSFVKNKKPTAYISKNRKLEKRT